MWKCVQEVLPKSCVVLKVSVCPVFPHVDEEFCRFEIGWGSCELLQTFARRRT